jgi:hypothetical protein
MKAKSQIKKKDRPEAAIGFRTSNFFRGKIFKPGGMKPGIKFNPTTFKTQHKG